MLFTRLLFIEHRISTAPGLLFSRITESVEQNGGFLMQQRPEFYSGQQVVGGRRGGAGGPDAALNGPITRVSDEAAMRDPQ